MSTILCLETATTNCSVALSENGSVIALLEDSSGGYSHGEKLHVYIEQVCKQANISFDQLDAIAVSKGPGSYTGLRIGVSAAKGLCFSLDIPLISIPTLDSLAHKINHSGGTIIPMLDARRMAVYSAVYDQEKDQIRDTRAEVLSETSYDEYLEKGRVYFVGNGVEKFQAICSHPNASFVPDELPSANEMGALAEAKFQNKAFEDVAYFEPFYLKDFIVGSRPKS